MNSVWVLLIFVVFASFRLKSGQANIGKDCECFEERREAPRWGAERERELDEEKEQMRKTRSKRPEAKTRSKRLEACRLEFGLNWLSKRKNEHNVLINYKSHLATINGLGCWARCNGIDAVRLQWDLGGGPSAPAVWPSVEAGGPLLNATPALYRRSPHCAAVLRPQFVFYPFRSPVGRAALPLSLQKTVKILI